MQRGVSCTTYRRLHEADRCGVPTEAETRLNEVDFSRESYRLPVPQLDGYRAAKVELRFSGSALLDTTSTDDLALLEAGRMGQKALLLVEVEFTGKGFRLAPGSSGERELHFVSTVKPLSIEAADSA